MNIDFCLKIQYDFCIYDPHLLHGEAYGNEFNCLILLLSITSIVFATLLDILSIFSVQSF